MPDVVALGDLNVDIIAHFANFPSKGGDALAYSTELHCGGSAANAAIALARLGVTVGLIARIGPDSWALKALHSLQTAGVDAGGLQRDPAAMTGLMYVVVTPDGDRTILGYRGANALTDPNQIREEYIQGAKAVPPVRLCPAGRAAAERGVADPRDGVPPRPDGDARPRGEHLAGRARRDACSIAGGQHPPAQL